VARRGAAGTGREARRMMRFVYHDSPVGPLLLAADDAALRVIEFPSPRHAVPPDATWSAGDNAILDEARAQLDYYFAGRRRSFDLPLGPRGTAFQCTVWRALADIPYGATISYAQLAGRVGKASAMRAVGAANGRNPLPIVLPCHRVIGSDGSLTGFGGGLPTKRFLLELEGALAPVEDLFGPAP
jgi:methylated-DNA-[protein]-cysteine S-methyltransferase